MLYAPERFDLNEWFDLFSAALPLTIAFLLPGRFTLIALTVFTVFSVFMAQTVDSLIAVKPYDLYDVNDTVKYDVSDIFIYYFSYPPTTYLFLYFYDKWSPKGWRRAGYVLAWSLLSWGLEWAAYRCHVFYYKGWKLAYSPIAYVVIYALFMAMFHMVETVMNREGYPMRRSGQAPPGGS
ncbi:hypothetical protein [Cohnella caldifontis]|uniref:hypothetical protein n=1 Tax=Cohnella caldifontis TaxID=3027471 RepID=UPI0023EBC574|nr:hypothetical protein [Cohnella sp. YIM B05605]